MLYISHGSVYNSKCPLVPCLVFLCFFDRFLQIDYISIIKKNLQYGFKVNFASPWFSFALADAPPNGSYVSLLLVFFFVTLERFWMCVNVTRWGVWSWSHDRPLFQILPSSSYRFRNKKKQIWILMPDNVNNDIGSWYRCCWNMVRICFNDKYGVNNFKF